MCYHGEVSHLSNSKNPGLNLKWLHYACNPALQHRASGLVCGTQKHKTWPFQDLNFDAIRARSRTLVICSSWWNWDLEKSLNSCAQSLKIYYIIISCLRIIWYNYFLTAALFMSRGGGPPGLSRTAASIVNSMEFSNTGDVILIAKTHSFTQIFEPWNVAGSTCTVLVPFPHQLGHKTRGSSQFSCLPSAPLTWLLIIRQVEKIVHLNNGLIFTFL